MATKFIHRRDEVLAGLRELRRAIPDVMTGFGNLHRASLEDGVLTKSNKELIALAIAVSSRCEGCVALHAHAALKAGATTDEIAEALGVAVMMGGGPAAVYAGEALEAVEQFHTQIQPTG